MATNQSYNRGYGSGRSGGGRRPGAGSGYQNRGQGGRISAGQARTVTTFNIVITVLTLIVGIVCFLIASNIYSSGAAGISTPLLIGLMFGSTAGILCLAVFIYSMIAGTFEKNLLTGGSSLGGSVAAILGAVVLVFLTSMFFEWIYELNIGEQNTSATSYIFVIDDSGSMQENDKYELRYAAIGEVLKSTPRDFPYMVYSFSDEVQKVRDMAPRSQGTTDFYGNAEGDTNIKAALEKIMADYYNHRWDGGKRPKVILLTDGYATDISSTSEINGLLRDFSSNNITISTVGLGSVDTGLMQHMAWSTGGSYLSAYSASELSEAMNNAAKTYVQDRDIISSRFVASFDGLYGTMRVLFLTILGTMIGVAVLFAYGYSESIPITIISSAVQSLVGALIMEIGIEVLGRSAGRMRFYYWILIAVTIGVKGERIRHQRNRTL